MRLDLEQQFIKRFVLKAKQDRYLRFVENPKRRSSFLSMLYHGQDLDRSKFQDLRGAGTHEINAILEKAHSLKNGDKCYFISVNKGLDGQEMSLNQAIKEIVNQEGTLLIFGDGAGAYWEGEPPFNRYLSL
ncbi:hypothetical protein MUN81_19825 [Hymenobacter sp. 5317J-9]|uniref:hypothetical protein n=1 Tax=Hymenobacter sp. 5317J-9 TaxID=2932250 RepID=UPI001FD71910|nr:hypothetical protein [Hymenobacter sp. 5317J-9]UOQ97472.1 hypothetical protein MUN81_19825 [Hymenobacter sp. 5317J-9]